MCKQNAEWTSLYDSVALYHPGPKEGTKLETFVLPTKEALNARSKMARETQIPGQRNAKRRNQQVKTFKPVNEK